MRKLADKNCSACAPGTPPLSEELRAKLGQEVPEWHVIDGTRIKREYKFNSYLDGARWVPLIGEIAEREDHHPDITLLYQKVIVELWTHTVNGLSENDYILAAKFDQAFESYPGQRYPI